MLDEVVGASEDLITRAMLGSYRARVLVVADDLPAARATLRDLDRASAVAHRGLAGIYRRVAEGELALAEHDWSRAAAIGETLARTARADWLAAMPAVSAMIDVLCATAELGLHEPTAAERARARARALYRRGRASFYAATALRIWAQAEERLGHAGQARRVLARAAEVANRRGGKLDRLAIAALAGGKPVAGPLAAAVVWSTGGTVT